MGQVYRATDARLKRFDDGGRRIDAEDTSGRNPPADVSRNSARPAPEVKHAGAGCEVRGEVSGGVGDSHSKIGGRHRASRRRPHCAAKRVTGDEKKYERPLRVNGRAALG